MVSTFVQLSANSSETKCKALKSHSGFISTRRWSNAETCSESSRDTSPTTSPAPHLHTRSDAGRPSVLPANVLLSFRALVDTEEQDDSVRSIVCHAKLQPTTYETADCAKSKVVAPVRHHQGAPPLTGTACSWRTQEQSSSGSPCGDDTERYVRVVRSILNKITAESFNTLFGQLVTCGIEQPEHVSKLMSEIFDKATKQHHFIPLYAELCMKLEQDPGVAVVVEAAGEKHSFRRLLLNQCQAAFEQLLESCDAGEPIDDDMAVKRKQVSLGNIKLIGHLLVHGMLSSKFFVECAEELIRSRAKCPDALESLAALMMVAAPTFDTPQWQHHDKLLSCFVTMRKLAKDKSLVPRSRFLLRDVLDAQHAGWPRSTRNPAIIIAEAQLREMNSPKPATKLDILSMAAAAPAPVAKPAMNCDGEPMEVGKGKGCFDLKTFRRTLAAILADLGSDRNLSAAVQRVRLAQVPVERQAEQFCDLLTRVVEEKRGPPRRTGMAFAAGLAAAEQSAFNREECLQGIVAFFRDVYPGLCDEVPRLPTIVRSELEPTLCNVFPRAEISSRLPPGTRF